ncbi:MAG: histidine kinase, partial [Pseudomonadota bacterium]|nr:histidine kinase [Pseudomonadota bacterium]
MSLVVFLIAYVIRRRLERADHLAGDEVWRNWFHRWGRVEAGQERSVWRGALLVVLPSLALAGAWALSSEAGYRYALYPLE